MKRLSLMTWIVAACGHAPAPCGLTYLGSDICAQALAMQLPAQLPPARGNRYGDDDDAAMLGFTLFFDGDLGTGVSCATCHEPQATFTSHTAVSLGKGSGTRNAPTVFNSARLSVFFWDGHADSLWSQPLFAIENPVEMGSSRLALAQLVAHDQTLASPYEKVFGTLPDMSAWPMDGQPGDPAFDALAPAAQTEVNRVAANVGKALEAYMRKNATSQSKLDRYLAGDPTQLTSAAQNGLRLFITQGCTSCHSGAIFSDEKFHDAGFPSLPGAALDIGRPAGIPILQNNVFNLSGPFADADTGAAATGVAEASTSGAFRTPSLRNVATTEPYGHDGAIDTLDQLLTLHAKNSTASERAELEAFLQALSGEYPPRPWSNWPAPQ